MTTPPSPPGSSFDPTGQPRQEYLDDQICQATPTKTITAVTKLKSWIQCMAAAAAAFLATAAGFDTWDWGWPGGTDPAYGRYEPK